MINLYSDTQSHPSKAMREAIAAAPVGDEQKGTDPTVTQLLEAVADRLGKQAALFLPSGTMCNVIAVASHCERGDAVIAETSSHLIRSESGGMGAISGVIPEAIVGKNGQFTAEQVRAHYQEGSRYAPQTKLVAVEQTCNMAGGSIWAADQLHAVAEQAKALGMNTHMDGARLFNAVVSSGVPAHVFCRGYDTVWVDFTKGLAAPLGAVLCGSHEFIDRAWRWKHRLGGAMRQGGMMAAGCLHALRHGMAQLEVDHAHAAMLNDGLKKNPFIKVRHERTESNIVYFSLFGLSCSPERFVERLAERGVKIGFVGGGLRALTYADISCNDIKHALQTIAELTEHIASEGKNVDAQSS